MDNLTINSHKGPYQLAFISKIKEDISRLNDGKHTFILDRKVYEIYRNKDLSDISSIPMLLIDANETSKSLENIPLYIKELINLKIKRDHCLVAIGGGIIQDITCFLASNLFRGMDWVFYPTTLLAQADSCIGSKSSINCLNIKNIIGSFFPPKKICIAMDFLSTLNLVELKSGIGEILKVHRLAGTREFKEVAESYLDLINDFDVLREFIYRSLIIKKKFIEIDEFDKNERNLLNYGHTFGHAIEIATNFSMPHGIAVTLGMDLANYLSYNLGYSDATEYELMHDTLQVNYKDGVRSLNMEKFFYALSKDKKNLDEDAIMAIIPGKNSIIEKHRMRTNDNFKNLCGEFLKENAIC